MIKRLSMAGTRWGEIVAQAIGFILAIGLIVVSGIAIGIALIAFACIAVVYQLIAKIWQEG